MAERGWGPGQSWDAELPLVPPTEWGPARELPPRPPGDPGGAPGPRRSSRALVTAIVVAVVVVVGAVGISVVVVDQFNRSRSSAAPPRPAKTTTTAPATTTTTLVAPALLAALRGRVPSPVTLDEGLCAPMLRAGTFVGQDLALWNPGPVDARPVPTEEDDRGEITTVMRRRYAAADPDRAVADALALFDSPRLVEVTGGDPGLRAALVELLGTFAEPALRYVLTTEGTVNIHWGMPQNERASGEAVGDGSNLDITILRALQTERPITVSPIIFHEILHLGGFGMRKEEVVNNVLDMRLAFVVARDFPEAFATNTEGARMLRWMIDAELNTRVGTQLTVTHSEVPNILPQTLGPPIADLVAEIIGPDGQGNPSVYADVPDEPTPGHATLEAVLASLADDGSAQSQGSAPDTSGMKFDDATIEFLDGHPGVPLCDQWVAAMAVGATPPGSSAARAAQEWLARLPT